MYVAGWAHLKAGDFSKAIERLENAFDQRWPGNGIEFPLLAIAYYRSSRIEDAKTAFAKSQQLADRWLEQSLSRRQGGAPIPWFDWLEFLVNHQEAKAVVNGTDLPDDPRLKKAESLAETSIQ